VEDVQLSTKLPRSLVPQQLMTRTKQARSGLLNPKEDPLTGKTTKSPFSIVKHFTVGKRSHSKNHTAQKDSNSVQEPKYKFKKLKLV